jgi:uncharacterized membrane protein
VPELFLVFKLLHVMAAATAVAIVVGSDFYFQRVVMNENPAVVAGVGRQIRRRNAIEGPIIEITILFGIGSALTGNFNLFAPWLLATYVILIVGTIVVFRLGAPAFTRIVEAADRGDLDEARRIARSRARHVSMAVSAGMLFGVIALMVIKPG